MECPTLAILVAVVKDTAQEKPLIPETGAEQTTEVVVNPDQHINDNLPTQVIDKPLIETFIIQDKIREPEVKIVIFFTKCYIKLIDTVAIQSIVKIVKKIFISYIFKGPVDGEMNCNMYTEWLGQVEATKYKSHPVVLKPEILQ